MIDPYEKILMVMREQGANKNVPFMMGSMKNSTDCVVDGMTLENNDYYKLNNVSLSEGDKVLITVVDDSWIILGKVV